MLYLLVYIIKHTTDEISFFHSSMQKKSKMADQSGRQGWSKEIDVVQVRLLKLMTGHFARQLESSRYGSQNVR